MMPTTRLHERYGAALQLRRQQRGLSQSQLGTLANISLKYVGEIERGEGNPTMDVLHRLALALEWDPFPRATEETKTIPDGVRTLLASNLRNIIQLAEIGAGWLERLDPALTLKVTPPLVRRRGRPRRNPEHEGGAS
jgi:transcriptional regulator with XRE-family HTH domain